MKYIPLKTLVFSMTDTRLAKLNRQFYLAHISFNFTKKKNNSDSYIFLDIEKVINTFRT